MLVSISDVPFGNPHMQNTGEGLGPAREVSRRLMEPLQPLQFTKPTHKAACRHLANCSYHHFVYPCSLL